MLKLYKGCRDLLAQTTVNVGLGLRILVASFTNLQTH